MRLIFASAALTNHIKIVQQRDGRPGDAEMKSTPRFSQLPKWSTDSTSRPPQCYNSPETTICDWKKPPHVPPHPGPPDRRFRWIAMIWGGLTALGGLTHGIGEIRQGPETAPSVVINSWARGAIAATLVSVLVAACSLLAVHRKYDGVVQLLLAGWAGTKIRSPLSGWPAYHAGGLHTFLARRWSWVFGLCLGASVLLLIGSVVLVVFSDVGNADFFLQPVPVHPFPDVFHDPDDRWPRNSRRSGPREAFTRPCSIERRLLCPHNPRKQNPVLTG